MRDSAETLSHSRIEEVRHQFEEWRKSRTKRTPIPEPLWDAAVSLVPEHSVCQVSKALRLDFKVLRERVRQRDSRGSLSFIEVDAQQLLCGGECIVEMEHRDGARMRMRLHGSTPADLIEIARAFWSRP